MDLCTLVERIVADKKALQAGDESLLSEDERAEIAISRLHSIQQVIDGLQAEGRSIVDISNVDELIVDIERHLASIGMSKRTLAKKTGLARSNLTRIFQRRTKDPNLETVASIVAASDYPLLGKLSTTRVESVTHEPEPEQSYGYVDWDSEDESEETTGFSDEGNDYFFVGGNAEEPEDRPVDADRDDEQYDDSDGYPVEDENEPEFAGANRQPEYAGDSDDGAEYVDDSDDNPDDEYAAYSDEDHEYAADDGHDYAADTDENEYATDSADDEYSADTDEDECTDTDEDEDAADSDDEDEYAGSDNEDEYGDSDEDEYATESADADDEDEYAAYTSNEDEYAADSEDSEFEDDDDNDPDPYDGYSNIFEKNVNDLFNNPSLFTRGPGSINPPRNLINTQSNTLTSEPRSRPAVSLIGVGAGLTVALSPKDEKVLVAVGVVGAAGALASTKLDSKTYRNAALATGACLAAGAAAKFIWQRLGCPKWEIK